MLLKNVIILNSKLNKDTQNNLEPNIKDNKHLNKDCNLGYTPEIGKKLNSRDLYTDGKKIIKARLS